jgi:outer membrane protein
MQAKIRFCTFFLLVLLTTPAHSESIKDIYNLVLKSDPRLYMDSLAVEIGETREKQAFGALLPQVSLNSVWSENTRSTSSSSESNYPGEKYSITLRQSLFDMQKYKAWQRTRIDIEQYVFQQNETQAQVRLDTIERYFELLKASDELTVVREEKESTESRLAQTKALFDKQYIKVTDYYEMEARLDLLESEEVDALQAVQLAKENIRELTNTDHEIISPLQTNSSFVVRVDNLDNLISNLANNNSTLKYLNKSIDSAKKRVEEVKATHLPVVDLQLSKQKSSIGYENAQSPVTNTEVAAISLNLPLFTGGQTSSRVDEATKQLSYAQASFDQEYRRISKELRDRYLGVNAVVRRLTALNKAVESAEKANQAMDKSFKLGIATVSDILDAQQALSHAKRSFQQARYDYVINKVNLQYLAGVLTDDVFDELSLILE